MRSDAVTETWEFYRDNCPGFKEPMRKRFRELDEYVAGLESENTKLRDELVRARDPQRIGGRADPDSFTYAIEQLREFRWQHATNDEDAIPYINNVAEAHERENAKLRELAKTAWGCVHARISCFDCRFIAGECVLRTAMYELVWRRGFEAHSKPPTIAHLAENRPHREPDQPHSGQ